VLEESIGGGELMEEEEQKSKPLPYSSEDALTYLEIYQQDAEQEKGDLVLMEVEELPECTECKYNEPPYFFCWVCKNMP